MNTEQMREQIDANRLEQMAKERPHECFLKGLGVLKLIGAIRQLEHEVREAALAASPAPIELTDAEIDRVNELANQATRAWRDSNVGSYSVKAEQRYYWHQVINLLSHFIAPQPEAAQPALQEDVRHETLKQINELEVIADWIACHSNTQWAKECGYPSIMIQYAEELHEIGLTLLARVDPDRASQLRAMQDGNTYYQLPPQEQEAAPVAIDDLKQQNAELVPVGHIVDTSKHGVFGELTDEGAELPEGTPLYAEPVAQVIASLKEKNAELMQTLESIDTAFVNDLTVEAESPTGKAIIAARTASAHQEDKQ